MAVLVADSMSLMFFFIRPQTRVCIVSSSFMTSILCFSCIQKSQSTVQTSGFETHNLVNHHQDPCLCVFHTFHIAKDAGTIPLIKSIFHHTTVGSAGSLGISRSWFEKEYICACVICYQIDVVQNAGSNAVAVCVGNQVRINVNS